MKNIITLILSTFLFPFSMFAVNLHEAYDVVPIEILPSLPPEGEIGDYKFASNINDHGVIMGYVGKQYFENKISGNFKITIYTITNQQPHFWKMPETKVEYPPIKEVFDNSGYRNGPISNQKDIVIYKHNQIVYVYKPVNGINVPWLYKYEVQLKSREDDLLDFDDEGNLYVQGHIPKGDWRRTDSYIQNINDPQGYKRKKIGQDEINNRIAKRSETLSMITNSNTRDQIQGYVDKDWKIKWLFDINQKGQILGQAIHEGQNYIIVLNPVS